MLVNTEVGESQYERKMEGDVFKGRYMCPHDNYVCFRNSELVTVFDHRFHCMHPHDSHALRSCRCMRPFAARTRTASTREYATASWNSVLDRTFDRLRRNGTTL